MSRAPESQKRMIPETASWGFFGGVLGIFVVFTFAFAMPYLSGGTNTVKHAAAMIAMGTSSPAIASSTVPTVPACAPIDTAAYDLKMLKVANYPVVKIATSTATSTQATSTAVAKVKPWPVRGAPYPKPCALLPFNRIVAYYGNFYSKGMGVLGQYPEEIMLDKLRAAVKEWEAADPATPVIPAIHYIATTAQGLPQKDGMYTLRMPDSQIDKAIAVAAKVHGVVFIDFQVGKSTLQKELPQYEKYLAMPNVHLGIDPEFSMKFGNKPGSVIGTLDAADINYAAQYLAQLVKKNNLPPKILVVHRFTVEMVTHYKNIAPLPEVQIVMDMDGWGSQAKKIGTYTRVIASEPVQFTGFKLFYKNDALAPSTGIFKPSQLMKLSPQPMYIQYQ